MSHVKKSLGYDTMKIHLGVFEGGGVGGRMPRIKAGIADPPSVGYECHIVPEECAGESLHPQRKQGRVSV